MRVDFDPQQFVSLGVARRTLIPHLKGKPVAPSTLWRWAHKGCRAGDGSVVRLALTYIGGTPMVNAAAVQQFFDELTARNRAADGAGDYAEQQRRRTPETERRLRDAGLL